MGLWPFKKKHEKAAPAADSIDAFWSWWADSAGRVANAIESGAAGEMVDEISTHVRAMDPSLAWELGPGRSSRHHICVSGEGNMALRAITERWVSRAPAPTAVWEYYPARQASVGARSALKLGPAEMAFEEFLVELDTDNTRRLVNVRVFHPEFQRLPEEQRGLATVLFLDGVLGEDGVERWIGAVDTTDTQPPKAGPAEVLLREVDRLGSCPGEESFAILEGRTENGLVVATINMALKRVDHLLLDQHYEIHIKLEDPTDQGLTTPEEGTELNRIEDTLVASLGPDAVYIGRETRGGERVIHFHASAVGPVPGRIAEWEKAHSNRNLETVATDDPQWEVLRRW